MSYLGRQRPTETTSSVLRSTYTGNGSTTTYALPGPVANETSIIATINGVTQQDAAYSTDGSNIVFVSAPASGDEIELRTISAVAMSYAPMAGSVVTGIIADGAVTTAKINDASVTGAKIASGVITQDKFSTNVAGNGPAFSAYQSTLNAVALNVYTKLSFQTELFDTNNNFDSTTNYRFTPTVTGYYQFSGSVFMSTGSGTRVGLLIYKNGVINCSSYGTGGSITGGQSQQITALLYANGTTDYFELYVLQDGIASVNTAASLNLTYFQGFLARSA